MPSVPAVAPSEPARCALHLVLAHELLAELKRLLVAACWANDKAENRRLTHEVRRLELAAELLAAALRVHQARAEQQQLPTFELTLTASPTVTAYAVEYLELDDNTCPDCGGSLDRPGLPPCVPRYWSFPSRDS